MGNNVDFTLKTFDESIPDIIDELIRGLSKHYLKFFIWLRDTEDYILDEDAFLNSNITDIFYNIDPKGFEEFGKTIKTHEYISDHMSLVDQLLDDLDFNLLASSANLEISLVSMGTKSCQSSFYRSEYRNTSSYNFLTMDSRLNGYNTLNRHVKLDINSLINMILSIVDGGVRVKSGIDRPDDVNYHLTKTIERLSKLVDKREDIIEQLCLNLNKSFYKVFNMTLKKEVQYFGSGLVGFAVSEFKGNVLDNIYDDFSEISVKSSQYVPLMKMIADDSSLAVRAVLSNDNYSEMNLIGEYMETLTHTPNIGIQEYDYQLRTLRMYTTDPVYKQSIIDYVESYSNNSLPITSVYQEDESITEINLRYKEWLMDVVPLVLQYNALYFLHNRSKHNTTYNNKNQFAEVEDIMRIMLKSVGERLKRYTTQFIYTLSSVITHDTLLFRHGPNSQSLVQYGTYRDSARSRFVQTVRNENIAPLKSINASAIDRSIQKFRHNPIIDLLSLTHMYKTIMYYMFMGTLPTKSLQNELKSFELSRRNNKSVNRLNQRSYLVEEALSNESLIQSGDADVLHDIHLALESMETNIMSGDAQDYMDANEELIQIEPYKQMLEPRYRTIFDRLSAQVEVYVLGDYASNEAIDLTANLN